MANQENQSFDDIVSGLGFLVGEDEIEARKVLGDERYEKTVAFIEATNMLRIKRESAEVKYVEAGAFLCSSIGFAAFSSVIFGLAWSIYFWVR